VALFVLDAILDVLLPIIFALFSGCFLHVFVLPVLACTRVAITPFRQFFEDFDVRRISVCDFLGVRDFSVAGDLVGVRDLVGVGDFLRAGEWRWTPLDRA
jgi:hypothetical protein